MLCFMMFLEMLSAADLPCRCEKAMRTKYLSLLQGKICLSMLRRIAMAIDNFKNRGYASLGGLILNRRNVKREDEKVAELADDFKTSVVGTLSRSEQVLLAEEKQQILLEAFPDSEMADEYRKLAEQILAVCEARG